MDDSFFSSAKPPLIRQDPALWFAFSGNRLLIQAEGESVRVPCAGEFEELGLTAPDSHYLGQYGERHCYAIQLDEDCEAPGSFALENLRSVALALGDTLFALAGRALQILHWDKTHRYCGQCGRPTERSNEERARKCPHCGLLHFPRLSPAIIVLVRRGRELLLGRSRLLPPGMYSILAGFVEPGEKLEEAVARELMEEVGIRVSNIHYFGSQPWPFPHSLMIGFTADYASGELQVDRNELEDAGWYSKEKLPLLPPKVSIARKLIDAFLEVGSGSV